MINKKSKVGQFWNLKSRFHCLECKVNQQNITNKCLTNNKVVIKSVESVKTPVSDAQFQSLPKNEIAVKLKGLQIARSLKRKSKVLSQYGTEKSRLVSDTEKRWLGSGFWQHSSMIDNPHYNKVKHEGSHLPLMLTQISFNKVNKSWWCMSLFSRGFKINRHRVATKNIMLIRIQYKHLAHQSGGMNIFHDFGETED